MKRDSIKQIRLNTNEIELLKCISKNSNESEVIRQLIESEFIRQRKERVIEAEKQLKENLKYSITGLETIEVLNLVDDLSSKFKGGYKMIIDRFSNEIEIFKNIKEE